MKYIKYLMYVIKHKWYVFIECCKLGIPIRGLLHDVSKLRPKEFFPYVNHFYGDESPRNEDGSYNPLKIGGSFDHAWLSHQHNNKHHWEYWILRGDSGFKKALEIPDKYRKEMIADWIGAGKAINGENDVQNWYKDNKDKMVLHENTRQEIESYLDL